MDTILQQPVAIAPGSGKQLKSLGVTHKLTSAQTNGAFYLCEAIFAPESASPLHIHRYEDEVIHVLEGAIDIRLDGRKLQAGVGGIIQLVFAIPGGLEGYFDEVDAALQNGSLDKETHTKISVKYGLEWLE